jgi:hypothetical protein
MLCVHHYIVSPVTLFRVLWRTHFKIVEYLHMVLHLITYDVFTNDSSVCLHLHGLLTTFMFFLSIEYLCVCMYYLGVCVYVCVHMEVSHIFFV